MIIDGQAWVFGDNIDTDVLAPGYAMKLPPKELAALCLQAVDPTFAQSVQPGDILIAGENFGLGSSREQAAISLKELGVGAVLARSFARIFYRNAMNIGLPAVQYSMTGEVKRGERVRLDLRAGTADCGGDAKINIAPIPDHLLTMVAAGGLMAQLERQVAEGQTP